MNLNLQCVALIFAIVVVPQFAAAEENLDSLLDAIRIVESGGEPNTGIGATGDAGKALGPYQIWKVYWQDAIEFDPEIGGKYEDCAEHEYSRKIIKAYFQRYGAEFLKNKDWESLARIHNGGPKGYQKKATLPYWEKVKTHFK